jgi:hypothetical protein
VVRYTLSVVVVVFFFPSEFEWKRRGFVVGYKERAEKMKERSTKIRCLIKCLNKSKGFFVLFFCFLFCFSFCSVSREGGIVGRTGTRKTRGRH